MVIFFVLAAFGGAFLTLLVGAMDRQGVHSPSANISPPTHKRTYKTIATGQCTRLQTN